MAAGDNSTVSITIEVLDANSADALGQVEKRMLNLQQAGNIAGTSVASTTERLKQLGAAGTGVAPALADIGTAAQTAGTQGAESFNQMGGAVQGVRLAVQEMGLRVPRAMESIIAHNEALATGLRATMGIFIAIGAIGIGVQLAEGVYHLYERWFDVNKEVEAYQQKAGEAAEQKLIDTSSIEEASALLTEFTNQVTTLNEKKQLNQNLIPFLPAGVTSFLGRVGGGFGGEFGTGDVSDLGATQAYTPGDDGGNAKAREEADKTAEHLRQTQAELHAEQLKGQAAYDSAVSQGYAKISSHEKDAVAEINQRYDNMKAQEANLVKIHNDGIAAMKAAGQDVSHETVEKADPNAFNQQRQAAITAAQQEAAGQRVALARSTENELIALDNNARNAQLQGVSLLRAQEEEAIAEVTRKYQQMGAAQSTVDRAVADTRQKYDAEISKALDEQREKIAQMQREAAAAGQTGIAKVQTDLAGQLEEINKGGENDYDLGSQYNRQTMRTLAEQKADNDILEQRKEFTQELADIAQHQDDFALSGYAKIEQETNQSLDRIAEAWKKKFGQLDVFNPSDLALMVAGLQQAEGAVDGVLQNAARERQKYTQEVDLQITQQENEAARLTLPPWQAAQEQILDQYSQRVQKIQNELQQQVAAEKGNAAAVAQSQQQAAQQAAAAWALANAQMIKQAEQSRDQIAGQLTSLIDNPAKYMEQRAKQLMSDILANWVQQLSHAHSGAGGGIMGLLGLGGEVGTEANPAKAISHIFGTNAGTAGAGATLSTAGSTLISAGGTLYSSGTILFSAANQLNSVATAIAGSGGFAGTGFNVRGAGGSGAGLGGFGGAPLSESLGLPSGFNGGSGAGTIFSGSSTSLSGGGIGGSTGSGSLSGAYSVANTATGAAGALAGASPGAGTISLDLVRQGISLTQQLQNGFNQSGSTAAGASQQLSGSFQPSDIAPTSASGVPGTVPGTGTDITAGEGDDAGGSGLAQGFGTTGGLISGGLGLYGGFESAYNSKSFASGLIGVGEDALAGASIGTIILPGLGTAIGAVAGATLGLFADIFGDHGRSKAEQYNNQQVLPALQKAAYGFGAGGSSYDSTTIELNSLLIQAQQQTRNWGSGAVSYYNSVIKPEIEQAEATIAREGAAGRSNVTVSAAQFDSGGVITGFGDLATGPFSGFIHAQLGERVMNRMASGIHGSTLDAMNAGSNALAMIHKTAPLTSAANYSGSPVHLHVHALDSKDVSRWLRGGGAQVIQSALNGNVTRYAGKALS